MDNLYGYASKGERHMSDYQNIRLPAYKALHQWRKDGRIEISDIFGLAEILGCEPSDFEVPMSERGVRLCRLLAGPHGWTVYCALKARDI